MIIAASCGGRCSNCGGLRSARGVFRGDRELPPSAGAADKIFQPGKPGSLQDSVAWLPRSCSGTGALPASYTLLLSAYWTEGLLQLTPTPGRAPPAHSAWICPQAFFQCIPNDRWGQVSPCFPSCQVTNQCMMDYRRLDGGTRVGPRWKTRGQETRCPKAFSLGSSSRSMVQYV